MAGPENTGWQDAGLKEAIHGADSMDVKLQKLDELSAKDYPDDFANKLKVSNNKLYNQIDWFTESTAAEELKSKVDALDKELDKISTGYVIPPDQLDDYIAGKIDLPGQGNIPAATPDKGYVIPPDQLDDYIAGKIDLPGQGDAPAVAEISDTSAAATERTPTQNRESFLKANKDKFGGANNEFFSKEIGEAGVVKSITMKFAAKSQADKYLQIQDIVSAPDKVLQKNGDTKNYTWDAAKGSYYNGNDRLLIRSGDKINVLNLYDIKTEEKPEEATMRETLAAKFGLDADKLTDMKMDVKAAITTYVYERNGEKYNLTIDLKTNAIKIRDKNGAFLDNAQAGRGNPHREENKDGNIQINWLIDEIQKDQGIDVKNKVDEKPEEKYEVINNNPKVEATAEGKYLIDRPEYGIKFSEGGMSIGDKKLNFENTDSIKVRMDAGKLVMTEQEIGGKVNIYQGKNGKEMMDSIIKIREQSQPKPEIKSTNLT